MVMPDSAPVQSTALGDLASGRMEIVSGKAYRVIADPGVDMPALSRVLDLLKRR